MASAGLRHFLILLFWTHCTAKKSKLELDCQDLRLSKKTAYLWNSCFVVQGPATNWWSARSNACKHFENGHLAALLTKGMTDAFRQAMKVWGVTSAYWVGANQYDQKAEPAGHWQWNLANGRKVPALVKGGQAGWITPNNVLGAEHCAQYSYSRGGINDIGCGFPIEAYALCQYDEVKKQRFYNRKLWDHVGHADGRLWESYENSQIDCAKMCSRDNVCHSFAYKSDDGHCLLNQDDGENTRFAPQPSSGYELFVWEWSENQ